jgi:hypothetical protein
MYALANSIFSYLLQDDGSPVSIFLCQGATLRTDTWLLVAMVLRDYEW